MPSAKTRFASVVSSDNSAVGHLQNIYSSKINAASMGLRGSDFVGQTHLSLPLLGTRWVCVVADTRSGVGQTQWVDSDRVRATSFWPREGLGH